VGLQAARKGKEAQPGRPQEVQAGRPQEVQAGRPQGDAPTIHEVERDAHFPVPKVGLRAMQERIEQAGGTLEIRGVAGEGTTLKARFPLGPSSTVLTEREREVLRLLVEGFTNRAIAEALSVSVETVKSHVHNVMQKMHVKDRTQAAVVATKQHWL